jgi:hypothetical protein
MEPVFMQKLKSCSDERNMHFARFCRRDRVNAHAWKNRRGWAMLAAIRAIGAPSSDRSCLDGRISADKWAVQNGVIKPNRYEIARSSHLNISAAPPYHADLSTQRYIPHAPVAMGWQYWR